MNVSEWEREALEKMGILRMDRAHFVSEMRNGSRLAVYDEISTYTIEASDEPGRYLVTDTQTKTSSKDTLEVIFDWFGAYHVDYGAAIISCKRA